MVAIAAALWTGQCEASPALGGKCSACHTSAANLPAAHPPLSMLTNTQCLSCHQAPGTSSLAPASKPPVATASAPASGTVSPPSAGSVAGVAQGQRYQTGRDQSRVQARDQAREQVQLQTQLRTQRAIRMGSAPDQPHKELHQAEQGTFAQVGTIDPYSFSATFGLLGSSDIAMHRGGWIFHGSTSNYGGMCGPNLSKHSQGDEDAISGTRLHLGFHGKHTTDLGNRERMIVEAGVNRDWFNEEDLGRLSGHVSVAWQKRSDKANVKVAGYVRGAAFDGSGADAHTNHTSLGLNLNYHHFLSGTETLSTCLRFKQRLYEGEEDSRLADWSGSIAYSRKTAMFGMYGVGLAVMDRNNPSNADKRYLAPSLFAKYGMPFGTDWLGEVSAAAQRRDFDALDRQFDRERTDQIFDVGLSVVSTVQKFDWAQLRLSCHYTQTSSTIGSYDGDEVYCATRLEKNF